MPTLRPSCLARPSVFKALSRPVLIALLADHAGYLADHGVALDQFAEDSVPLDPLLAVLGAPGDSVPPELVERLELFCMISGDDSSLRLEAGYHELVGRIRRDGDSPADLAVRILLEAPEVAWREFDRRALVAERSRSCFSVIPGHPFRQPTAALVKRFESMTGPWFAANARSAVCRLHVRSEPDGVAFVIRHGDPIKRLEVLTEEGDSESCILRPERVDVARYRSATGEWQISGLGSKLRTVYREAFGTVFHGSPRALVVAGRYSLEPLRQGRGALRCRPGEIVQSAELRQLTIEAPTGQRIKVDRGDVMRWFEQADPGLLRHGVLCEAVIAFKLRNRRRLLQVVIKPESDVLSGVPADGTIELWLVEHGFTEAYDGGALVA